MCLLADLLLQLVILRSLSVIETCWHAVEQKTLSWAVLVHDIKTISLLFTTSWQTDIHLISPGFFFHLNPHSWICTNCRTDWLILCIYLLSLLCQRKSAWWKLNPALLLVQIQDHNQNSVYTETFHLINIWLVYVPVITSSAFVRGT